MKTAIFLVSLLVSSIAAAIDVNGIEVLNKRRISGDTTERMYATLSLQYYYRGIADSIQFIQGSNGVVVQNLKPWACLPSTEIVSKDFVQGMLEGEIKKTEFYESLVGRDWKNVTAATYFMFGLRRAFPCK